MVKIIRQNQLNDEVLNRIVDIKKKSWDYTVEEHKKWINNNLMSDDYHLLMYEENNLIGYMNLVNIKLEINDKQIETLGIGNVCTRYKGRGDGKYLLKEVNNFLIQSGKIGLLFCKNHLVEFYKKNQWILIKNLHPDPNINTLIFNSPVSLSNLTFNDRLF